MKRNGRFWLITVTLLLVLAVFLLVFLFGWLDSSTAPVILPETTASIPAGSVSRPEGLSMAAVTPETVQAVLATLVKPDAYSRSLTVERFWQGGSSTWQVQVWQKGGMTRISVTPEIGAVRHILCDSEQIRLWYEGSADRVFTYSPGSAALADTLQMLPSYEDVLALDPAAIIEAGYVQREGQWRIMTAARPEGEYLTVYYLSIETGLLEYAERWDGDTLVYRMTAGTADLAAPPDSLFTAGTS